MNIVFPIQRLPYCRTRHVAPEHQEKLGEIALHLVTDGGSMTIYLSRDHADEIARTLGNAVAAYDMEGMEVEQDA